MVAALVLTYGVILGMAEVAWSGHLESLDVPLHHLAMWADLDDQLREECRLNATCKDLQRYRSCWGYEKGCTRDRRFHRAVCDGPDHGWTKGGDRNEQEKQFFESADFGYIQKRIDEMTMVCRGAKPGDSFVECVDNARLCRARNVFIDFGDLSKVKPPVKYSGEVLAPGRIGGKCRLNVDKLKQLGQHEGALQSWYAEIKHFTVVEQRMDDVGCSMTIEEPTMIVKLDATVNMYHHFCDFVNLYASMHFLGNASADVNVIIWDSMPYRSNFLTAWKSITNKPLRYMGEFSKKGKICFKNLVMPFPPRMILGFYYNMPLIPGCHGSGLMRSFKEHILHRMRVPIQPVGGEKIRVTLISRTTNTRRVLNEDELLAALNTLDNVVAAKIDFNFKMPFDEQIKISANTDLLIGLHGAGLTHALFLPENSAVFEIFNCGDPGCYSDLSRLVGARYFTWTDRSKLEAIKSRDEKQTNHEKFSNYRFDAAEFTRIAKEAIDHIRKVRGKRKRKMIHDEM